jgi:hypothetical protein
MDNAAVIDSLKIQSNLYPSAFLCPPRYANAKSLDLSENRRIWAYTTASAPNTLNAWFNNNGKSTFKGKKIGKSLRIKMSHQSNAVRKTFLLSNTPVSLSTYSYLFGRGP